MASQAPAAVPANLVELSTLDETTIVAAIKARYNDDKVRGICVL